MDNLNEKFKELPAGSFPDGFHAGVIRMAYARRYRVLFVATFVILCWNLAMAVWGTWERMIQLDSVSALRDILASDFALRSLPVSETAEILADFLPLRSILAGAINLLCIVYMAWAFTRSRLNGRHGRMLA